MSLWILPIVIVGAAMIIEGAMRGTRTSLTTDIPFGLFIIGLAVIYTVPVGVAPGLLVFGLFILSGVVSNLIGRGLDKK